MFKSNYQSGSSVEVMTTRSKAPLAGWRIVGGVSKQFNKECKGFVIQLADQARISLPANDRGGLGLVQSQLVFQIMLPPGKLITIEIAITDLAGVKRRLVFTNQSHLVVNPLHARIPNGSFKKGVWNNLCFDLTSFFMEIFPSKTFRSIDGIYIGGECLLRRIYTMKLRLRDTTGEMEDEVYTYDMLPHAHEMPRNVLMINQFITASRVIPQTTPEPIEPERPKYFSQSPPRQKMVRKKPQYRSVFSRKPRLGKINHTQQDDIRNTLSIEPLSKKYLTVLPSLGSSNSHSVKTLQTSSNKSSRKDLHDTQKSNLRRQEQSRARLSNLQENEHSSAESEIEEDLMHSLKTTNNSKSGSYKRISINYSKPAPEPNIFLENLKQANRQKTNRKVTYYSQEMQKQLVVKPFSPPIIDSPMINL